MRLYILAFTYALSALSLLAQESNPAATPWRDGKPMSQASQVTQTQQASTDIQSYAPYHIALLPNKPGSEIVLPFMTGDNSLVFFTLSQVQQASKDKVVLGRLISYGELIALIGELQTQANQLKQENDKLWAVVGKGTYPPQTAVVQQTPAPTANAPETPTRSDNLTKYLLLRQLFPAQQPYQLPMPSRPNNGINCVTRYNGSTAYTDCY